MKAIRYTEHGPPDVLRLIDMPVPVPTDQQVLVRIRAASINPVDWHMMRGEPSFLKWVKPAAKGQTPGSDFAGQVEQVGARVTEVRPGDEVFGTARGSVAEYACTQPDLIASKPARLTFEQAAVISLAGRTALQALRDHGRLQPRQTVLINGAAGGVGTFAVQIARAMGAEVTAVCSTRNVDLVRSIGAHHVIDYTIEDFATTGRKYDVVIQLAGIRTNDELRGALAPRGRLVLVGGGTGRVQVENPSVPEMLGMFAGNLLAPFMRQPIRVMMTKGRKGDLVYLGELVEAGKLMPVIDRTYPLTEAADAMRQLEAGHVRGKVVVTV